jgi:hypothetical protein
MAAADLDGYTPGRVTPRECIRAARDALNKAYGCGGSRECWPFIMEAIDWQRRAVEQLADTASIPKRQD